MNKDILKQLNEVDSMKDELEEMLRSVTRLAMQEEGRRRIKELRKSQDSETANSSNKYLVSGK